MFVNTQTQNLSFIILDYTIGVCDTAPPCLYMWHVYAKALLRSTKKCPWTAQFQQPMSILNYHQLAAQVSFSTNQRCSLIGYICVSVRDPEILRGTMRNSKRNREILFKVGQWSKNWPHMIFLHYSGVLFGKYSPQAEQQRDRIKWWYNPQTVCFTAQWIIGQESTHLWWFYWDLGTWLIANKTHSVEMSWTKTLSVINSTTPEGVTY